MHRRPAIRTFIVATVAATCLTTPVLAQADLGSMAHNAAANELGVLEYCQSKGAIDGSAITAQKTVIARLPATTRSTDTAEALGRQGTLLGGNDTNVSLADMAAKSNVTESDLCTRMAGSVKQASTTNPAMSMPTMPTGMPVMPNGMPAMPTVPH